MNMALTQVPTGTPVSDEDPFSDDVLADPLPFQHRLREAGPVVHLSSVGVYAMGRHAEVFAALTDWQDFVSSRGVGVMDFAREKPYRTPSLLLEADPPRHDAPREVITKILSVRALRRLQDRWAADAERLVEELLDGSTGPVPVDGVRQLAAAYPLRVFPDAVGIGTQGRENLIPYGSFAFNAFGPRNKHVIAGEATLPAMAEWIGEQCRRENLTEDGYGAQIYASADRGEITHEQAPLIIRSLLTAGVDTTVNGIAALLHALADHPEQYELLRSRPGLARGAFDEAVRYESPVQTFFRTAPNDIDVSGTLVPAGRKILMFLGSANRDPRRWERPDEFDVSRDPSGHVGFGMGIHRCAGQHVARLESASLLAALLPRVKRIELAGEPRRTLNNTLRSWERLPLRLVPA